MASFVLRKLVLQTHMGSHWVGLDAWFFGRTRRLVSFVRTARMRRLVWVFAGRLGDKYHNLMSWPIYSLTWLYQFLIIAYLFTFNMYSSKEQHFAPDWSFVSNTKQLRQPITSNVNYDVGAPTVYRKTHWRKLFTLSSQMSRYIRKCIRVTINFPKWKLWRQ